MGACLSRRSKTGMRVEYWVLRAVHLSLRVAKGRGSQYTEGEGDRSRKKSNSGKGFYDKILTIATEPGIVAVPERGWNINT